MAKKERGYIATRLSDFEFERLERIMKKAGLSKSEILRFALFEFENKYFDETFIKPEKR